MTNNDQNSTQSNKLPPNFGDIPEEYSNFKRAKVVVVPVPYEATTTYRKGTMEGPHAIIEASSHMETFDDELSQETFKNGIHTMDQLQVEGLSSEDMLKNVGDTIKGLAEAGKFPVVLGGEHSVSIAPVQTLKKRYPELSVLYLDAHYDLKDEFNDNKFNHACTARRICEIVPVVEVGVRSLSKDEKDFLNNIPADVKKVEYVDVYNILNDPVWKDKVVDLLSKDVYISIDLDVFDPAVVPSVGTPEPGGIGWYEFLELLNAVIMKKNIVGFDVMEICPNKDSSASDFLAAKLIYRLIGYLFSPKRLSQVK